ncbi:hypothetical protein [Thauera humireducens]|uniref:hypothetical protein n=1 Tax=Thauera humireducens TaxID=1134435 RepID=UPI00311D7A99
MQHFTLIVWLPTFLRDQRGLEIGWVALLSCVMVLVNVPGNVIGGRCCGAMWRAAGCWCWAAG